jgi:ribose-phosphate pyrophosphokinase
MDLIVLAGSANPALADTIAERLGGRAGRRALTRFPDSELHVEIQDTVRGADVYIVQPTGPPVDRHVMELLFMADACRRAGAARMTAVVPYFGYARQDRRASGREAVGARLAADLLVAAGLDRVIAVDLHSSALEGFFGLPLEHLSATALLANAVEAMIGRDGVIVAPDLGAVKLAERYADLLRLPIAIVHKTRLSGEAVKVRAVVGEVRGRAPVIVDDMISTGATIEAASKALLDAGCLADLTVIATHALLVGHAIERLAALELRRLVVADSLALPAPVPLPIQVVGLAPMLAEAISRLNVGESLSDMISHR